MTSPGIFVEDFERTENSDSIQAIIGRGLILATRFDLICAQLYKTNKIQDYNHSLDILDDKNFLNFVNELYKDTKYKNLKKTIESFEFPKNHKNVLNKARIARNQIAHDVCKNLIGCIETNKFIDEKDLIERVAKLSKTIIEGDALVSILMSIKTKEPLPRPDYITSYKKKLLEWVIEP